MIAGAGILLGASLLSAAPCVLALSALAPTSASAKTAEAPSFASKAPRTTADFSLQASNGYVLNVSAQPGDVTLHGLPPVSTTPNRLGRKTPARRSRCHAASRHTHRRFRREAVELARVSDKSVPKLAKDLGISDQTLREWIKRADIDAGHAEGLSTDEREELRRLRRENRTLLQEREVLKKAAAFFARESEGR